MQFIPLEVTDYKQLKKYFENQKYSLSSYSLFSLIVWSNQKLKTYYTIENDTLIICNKSSSNPENNHLILPISPIDKFPPKHLFTLAKKLEISSYWFVPEDFLSEYDHEEVESYFSLTEQNEFHDYIYLTEDLAHLKGNKYTKQRNLIHQFHKKYVDRGKVDIEKINSDNTKECMGFLNEWCELRKCDLEQNESMACEKTAAINALNNIDNLEVKGILIRLDGVVSAFGIMSHLTDIIGVLNFEKAHSHVKGLYQFLDNECAKRLFSGYKYINKESDMELPNLAQSKKSYNPIMMIKSYCLTVR